MQMLNQCWRTIFICLLLTSSALARDYKGCDATCSRSDDFIRGFTVVPASVAKSFELRPTPGVPLIISSFWSCLKDPNDPKGEFEHCRLRFHICPNNYEQVGCVDTP